MSGSINETSFVMEEWYALRVFFNKASDISRELNEKGIETYLPMTNEVVETAGGKLVSRQRPLIGSLLFIRSRHDAVKALARNLSGRASVYAKAGNLSEPAPIPESEMTIFRLVTSCDGGPLEFLGGDLSRWSIGELVRVAAGPLKGAVGRICRIKGNRRLVVVVNGVCAVATAYVPARFLQKLNDSSS